MKNRSFFILPAILLLFTASCKKDYTCTCSETVSGTVTVVGTLTFHDSKKNAESKCSQASTSDYGGTGAFVSCALN